MPGKRWANLRVSQDGRTMSDVMTHRRNATGQKVDLPTEGMVMTSAAKSLRRRITAKYDGECECCGVKLPEGSDIVWFPKSKGVKVVCPDCEPHYP